mmetsp:Transcript_18122/g.57562  ORF Transcript_18122/g.57562 Transcript_18122/m.57562 type:complete len:336 (-) Transcript_18122:1238-2245(-)
MSTAATPAAGLRARRAPHREACGRMSTDSASSLSRGNGQSATANPLAQRRAPPPSHCDLARPATCPPAARLGTPLACGALATVRLGEPDSAGAERDGRPSAACRHWSCANWVCLALATVGLGELDNAGTERRRRPSAACGRWSCANWLCLASKSFRSSDTSCRTRASSSCRKRSSSSRSSSGLAGFPGGFAGHAPFSWPAGSWPAGSPSAAACRPLMAKPPPAACLAWPPAAASAGQSCLRHSSSSQVSSRPAGLSPSASACMRPAAKPPPAACPAWPPAAASAGQSCRRHSSSCASWPPAAASAGRSSRRPRLSCRFSANFEETAAAAAVALVL